MTIDASERDHRGWTLCCRLCRHSENIVMNKSFNAHPGSNTLCSFFSLTATLHSIIPVRIDFIPIETVYTYRISPITF